jgi:hypothetical protein
MADKSTSSAAPADTGEPSIEELANHLSGTTGADASAEEADDEEMEQSDEDGSEQADTDLESAGSTEADDSEGEEEQGEDTEMENDEESDEETETSEDDQEADENAGTKDQDEESDEETQSIRKKFTPEQQKLFDKALSKKAKRVIELRSEVEQARREAAEAKSERDQLKAGVVPNVVAPTADNPLAGVTDEKALETKLQKTKELRRWALTHPKGGTLKSGEEEFEISEDRVGEIIAETEEVLNHHVPKRREFLRLRSFAESEAAKEYPWFADKASAGRVRIEAMLNQYPVLQEVIPDIRPVLADVITMQAIRAKNRQAAAASKGKPGVSAANKSVPKAPSVPTGARPPKVAGAVKAKTAAHKRLDETGEDPDGSALGALIRQS